MQKIPYNRSQWLAKENCLKTHKTWTENRIRYASPVIISKSGQVIDNEDPRTKPKEDKITIGRQDFLNDLLVKNPNSMPKAIPSSYGLEGGV